MKVILFCFLFSFFLNSGNIENLDPAERLPPEILILIMSFCDTDDLENFALVNKKWREIAISDFLWRPYCLSRLAIDNNLPLKVYYQIFLKKSPVYACLLSSEFLLAEDLKICKKIIPQQSISLKQYQHYLLELLNNAPKVLFTSFVVDADNINRMFAKTKNAIKKARKKDVLMVLSAGSENKEIVIKQNFFQAYPNIVFVGTTKNSSNYGKQVLLVSNNTKTTQAALETANLMFYLRTQNPTLTACEIINLVANNADKSMDLRKPSRGIINKEKSILAIEQSLVKSNNN